MLTADGLDKATQFYLLFTQEPVLLLFPAAWALLKMHQFNLIEGNVFICEEVMVALDDA